MNMNIRSDEEVSGMAIMFGTAGAPPPHFLHFGFWMLQLNEDWVTIEPELGHNDTSTGCQFKNFAWKPPFYWALIFLKLGLLLFHSAHSLLFAAFDRKQNNNIKNKPTKNLPRTR
jgi:hypothetical protein